MRKKIIFFSLLLLTPLLIIIGAVSKTKATYTGFPEMTYEDYNYLVYVSYTEEQGQDLLVDAVTIGIITNNTLYNYYDDLELEGWRSSSGDQILNNNIYFVKLDLQAQLILKAIEYNQYVNNYVNQETYDYYNSGVSTGASYTNSESYEKGAEDQKALDYTYFLQVIMEQQTQFQEQEETIRQQGYEEGIQHAQSQTLDQPQLYNMLKQVALYPVLLFTEGLNVNIFGINIGGLLLGIFMIAVIVIIIKMVIGIIR